MTNENVTLTPNQLRLLRFSMRFKGPQSFNEDSDCYDDVLILEGLELVNVERNEDNEPTHWYGLGKE